MTASAKNGFGQIAFNPAPSTACGEVLYDFHPMYSSSAPQIGAGTLWSGHPPVPVQQLPAVTAALIDPGRQEKFWRPGSDPGRPVRGPGNDLEPGRPEMTTRSLLRYGILAGPLYVTVALAQALTRTGFDLTRHAWSLLSNGHLGWIQITNFVLTGVLTMAAAVGLRRALPPGRARTWVPVLVGTYGASLVGAGVFRADPAQGFPVGTPRSTAISWHGMLHFAIGGIGFLCLIAACFVLAGRFAREGRTGLAWFSRITGAVFLAGFAGIASGSAGPTTLAFVAAVLTVCAWLSTVSVRYYRAA
jgi:hypothetical membrane protein